MKRQHSRPEEVFDLDASGDPYLLDYEAARSLTASDWQAGSREMERLAHSGSIMALLFVAEAMRDGRIYDQDLPGAENWFNVAVESTSVRGLWGRALTHLYMGRTEEAVGELEEAINRIYPPAMNSLARLYFTGTGVEKNKDKALALWRKASKMGHLPSRRNLIIVYMRGEYGARRVILGLGVCFLYIFKLYAVYSGNRDTDRLR